MKTRLSEKMNFSESKKFNALNEEEMKSVNGGAELILHRNPDGTYYLVFALN